MDKYTTMTILKKCLFLLPSIAIVLFMTSCNHVVNKDSYQYIDLTSAHTLMWKVENAEKKEIAYVFGTMHLQHKSFFENIEGWDSVFNSCDAVCIESFFGAKMTSSDNSQMMEELMPNDTTYEDILGEKTKALRPYVTDWKYRPYVIRNAFILSLYAEIFPKLIHNTKNHIELSKDYMFMDLAIQNRTLAKGKKIVFLDGVIQEEDTSMNKTQSKSLREEVLALYEEVTHRDSILRFHLAADSAYYFHDLERFSILINQDSLVHTKQIIHDRNEKWMPQIVSSIQKQSTFIAVGMAHLIPTKHDKGILQRLKDLGYTVTPYKNE